MADRSDEELDFYELLGIEITAATKEITKAYRAKALKVHPDKNPSPDAAALFHKLSKAYEVLNDQGQRSEYDKTHRARLDRLKRKEEMDSKRRAEKEKLEERESKARKTKTEQSQAMAQYKAELARLRAEGNRRREEEERQKEEELKQRQIPKPTDLDYALKLKWKRKTHAWTAEEIKAALNPIGKVDTIAVSDKGKKKVSALVVFEKVDYAHAVIISKDVNPALQSFESIDWASGEEPALVTWMKKETERMRVLQKAASEAKLMAHDLRPSNGKPLFASAPKTTSLFQKATISKPSSSSSPSKASDLDDDDFEAVVLMRLRQAERDKLKGQEKDSKDNKG